VNYSAVNNGSGSVWGGITGTLSDQTDLQNALNAKVPYSGATGQVDLGNYDLKVQGLTIGKGNNSLVNNTALGHSTLLTATTGNFNTAVGYESLRNTTTGQYNTAVGQSSLFSNTTGGQNTALGLNALLSNTTGSSNVAVGLDTLQHITTGSSNTAIGYNAGSHITGGSTPNTTATNSVFIGRDSKANADGQTNQIVIGQNAVGNGSNTATFGNTATTANYFTGSINGGSFVKSGGTSSQFLKADGSVDSTTYVSGSGVAGQVAYWDGTSSQTGSNNLFWDAANSRLGIGTNAPSQNLVIQAASNPTIYLNETSGFTGSNILTSINYVLSPLVDLVTLDGQSASQYGIFRGGIIFGVSGYNGINFYTNNTRQGRFFQNGNFILQNGGTFTDGGQRLQVMGDAFIKGSGATSATTALTIQDSAGTNLFRVRNDSTTALTYLRLGTSFSNSPFLFPITTNEGNPVTSGTNLSFYSYTGASSATAGAFVFSGDPFIQTSSSQVFLRTNNTFAPTSGTADLDIFRINFSINQTGGANGITRGLYVNPTLTAAADWRSIEWSNNSGWGLYGAGTANNYLNGDTAIGTATLGTATKLTIGGSETAASGNARGVLVNTTLNASANSDLLIGLDIQPTFTPGIYTNTSPVGMRLYNPNTLSALDYGIQLRLQNTQTGQTNTDGFLISIDNSAAANAFLFNYENASLIFGTNGTANARLFNTGNFVLQNGGSFTDAGFRLDVNGTARVSTSLIAAGATSASSGSIAFLTTASAAGTHAAAIGYNANASASHGIAIGYDATASANPSVAIGKSSVASGTHSTAFAKATSSGNYSVGFGNGTQSIADHSFATGQRTYAYLAGQMTISSNNISYVGDSQASIVSFPLNTGVVSSGGTYSFTGIRPNNATFGSGVTQIWRVQVSIVFAVKGKTNSITEFNLNDTFTTTYELAVKSNSGTGTSIIASPILINNIADTNLSGCSVSFSIVSNNLVASITPPTWASGQADFRGTIRYDLTELGNYGQTIV
jgi:hypothetical protein